MSTLSQTALDQLFRTARTHSAWQQRPVEPALLREIYALCKWGPTSANCSPLRIVFVTTPEGKARLVPCMDAGNRKKTQAAPVTAILAQDMEFYEKLPQLFPHADARSWFAGQPEKITATALRNSSLQAAYFMLAARALGLDCGPMSGFDHVALDKEFFCNTSLRTNFVCNLGYGDPSALHPRLPRLAFEEACKTI